MNKAGQTTMKEVLEKAIEAGATDIHLGETGLVYVRLGTGLERLEKYRGSSQLLEALLDQCGVPPEGRLLAEALDLAFSFSGERVRSHFYRSGSSRWATLRILYNKTVDLEQDAHRDILKRLARLKEGLVLITGPTGSGKSYTLACCLEYVNRHYRKHIITLEDPVEFTFCSNQSLIHQRQLGRDVESMAAGVRDALREDPDIIMIGELRDRTTLEAALHAAETGHLVFATMHTQRAVMAISRMLSIFPASQQEEVRSQLSQVLRAVICQRLTVIDGSFVVVRDILLNTPAVANLIRQRKEPQIISVQETQYPMQTLEMAVSELKKQWGYCPELEEILEQDHEMV